MDESEPPAKQRSPSEMNDQWIYQYARRRCAVCQSARNHLLFRQQFAVLSAGNLMEGYDVVACDDCGFVFADGIPAQQAFDSYYAEMSKYETTDEGGGRTAYDTARFETVMSILAPYLNSESRILEVGCAAGALLSLLQDRGFRNVIGVDPSPRCGQVARRLYGVQVKESTLSEMVFNDGSLDFIIALGVLEHVRDLEVALDRLNRMLAPQGRLYVGVPDSSRYAEGQDAPFQEFSMEHINFLGPNSLSNLLRAHGFRLLRCLQDSVQPTWRTNTPVLHAVFEKETRSYLGQPIPRDEATEAALVTYIEKSRVIDERIHCTIEAVVARGKPIVVWGTGTHTLRLLATSRLADASIEVFVDANPKYQGKKLKGIPIISPADFRNWSVQCVLISSCHYQHEILHRLRDEIGYKDEIITFYEE